MRRRQLIAIALVGLSQLVAAGQPADRSAAGAAYGEVLATYLRDPEAAVRAVMAWSRADIGSGVEQLPRTQAGVTLRSGGEASRRLLQQLALLHAEAAFAHYRRSDNDLMAVHLEWSRRFVWHELPWPAVDLARALPIGRGFRTEWALLEAGFFQLELAVSDARQVLDDELSAAPRDAMLLLARGITEEIAVSERAQPRAFSEMRVNGLSAIGVRGPDISRRRRATLATAASFYRRALASDAALHEARVRLARTLSELGEIAEAERHLDDALARPLASHEEYLAHLFAAALHEQHGRHDSAEGHFSRAAELYPGAQTPYLGLSRLKALDDPVAAGEILLKMFGGRVATGGADVADPWWLYDAGVGASFQARLHRLRMESGSR